MDSLRFIELATVVMVVLVVLMMVLTVSVKTLHYLKVSWYKRNYKKIEPALEEYILTGEDQPKLLRLWSWQRDLFLSRLIVERMALLRGTGQESLMRLAADMGLVDKYLKALKSRRRWRRARAAEYLGYFGGERAIRPLGKLLSDEDETIRAVTARALARIGSEEAVRLLVRTLGAPSELTRLRVAENLERVGHPVVGPLVNSLEDATDLGTDQLYGQIMAVRVLGNLRAAEAREVLRQATHNGQSSDLRAQATLALGKIGDLEDVPTLLKSAWDESWPVRAQAANALGMIGEVSTVPTLKKLAADKEWWVRLNAAKALANMGPEGLLALLELLQGDDRYARARAAATLESRGITRRMVRQLAAPDRKGERARTIIRAVIESGATKHLRSLAETLPEGEERRILRDMLEEHDELVKVDTTGSEQTTTDHTAVEPPEAEPTSAKPREVELSLEDLEEVISAVGDYRKKLDRESKVISDFVQDLVEYMEQDGSRRDKTEENHKLAGQESVGDEH